MLKNIKVDSIKNNEKLKEAEEVFDNNHLKWNSFHSFISANVEAPKSCAALLNNRCLGIGVENCFIQSNATDCGLCVALNIYGILKSYSDNPNYLKNLMEADVIPQSYAIKLTPAVGSDNFWKVSELDSLMIRHGIMHTITNIWHHNNIHNKSDIDVVKNDVLAIANIAFLNLAEKRSLAVKAFTESENKINPDEEAKQIIQKEEKKGEDSENQDNQNQPLEEENNKKETGGDSCAMIGEDSDSGNDSSTHEKEDIQNQPMEEEDSKKESSVHTEEVENKIGAMTGEEELENNIEQQENNQPIEEEDSKKKSSVDTENKNIEEEDSKKESTVDTENKNIEEEDSKEKFSIDSENKNFGDKSTIKKDDNDNKKESSSSYEKDSKSDTSKNSDGNYNQKSDGISSSSDDNDNKKESSSSYEYSESDDKKDSKSDTSESEDSEDNIPIGLLSRTGGKRKHSRKRMVISDDHESDDSNNANVAKLPKGAKLFDSKLPNKNLFDSTDSDDSRIQKKKGKKLVMLIQKLERKV